MIIYFEDGVGGLLSISPALDVRSRREVLVSPATETAPAVYRKETDQEVGARAAQTVPVGADYEVFVETPDEAALDARFPGTVEARTRFVREATLKALETIAEDKRAAVMGTLSPLKLAVYQQKYTVAVAALSGDIAAVSTLTPEASARGETVVQLATLVKTLGDRGHALGLAIDANYQQHKAAIIGAQTAQSIQSRDLLTGWPL